MITKIERALNLAYQDFVSGYAEPQGDTLAKIKIPIVELFETQKNADKAKCDLGRDFEQAIHAYFESFITGGKPSFKRLKTSFLPYEKVFQRHLGKERVSYLKLLFQIHDSIDEKKPGLLFEGVS